MYKDTNGVTPMVDSSIQLKIKILNPGQDCVLYEQWSTVDTSASSGYFTVQVGAVTGDTSRRKGDDPGLSMAQIYSNSGGSLTGKALSNGANCTYFPSASDERRVRLEITPSSDSVTRVLSTNMSLDSVPSAIVAERAESLQGYTPSNFIQVSTTSPANLTQTNVANIFSTTNYPRLVTLLSNGSSGYVQTGSNGVVVVPTVGIGSTSGLTSGQMWFQSGVLKYYDGSAIQTVGATGSGITSLVAGTGLTGGTITTGGQTIAVDVGTTSGQIVQVAAGNKLPAIDGSNLTNLNGASITGVISGSTSINTTGNIQTTGSTTQNRVFLYDHSGVGPGYIGIAPPNNIAGSGGSSYTLTLPDRPGTVGQVMVATTSTGTMGWSSLTGLSNSTGDITLAATPSSGSVIVNSGTAATSATSGALIVTGGAGFSGAVYTNGMIYSAGGISSTSPVWSPQIYGSSSASGDLKIDGTSHATPGNVLLSSAGGHVGIGMTNPINLLDVRGGMAIGAAYAGVRTAPTDGLIVKGNLGVGIFNPTYPLEVQTNDANGPAKFENINSIDTDRAIAAFVRSDTAAPGAGFAGRLDFQLSAFSNGNTPRAADLTWGWESAQTNDTTDRDSFLSFSTMADDTLAERFRITSAGRVGIGTTTPGAALHVIGDVKVGGNILDANGQISYSTNGRHFANVGNASNPSYSFQSDSNTGMYVGSVDDNLGFVTNGVDRLHIDTTGNVGIGTTTPGRLLHVNGPIRMTASTSPSSAVAGDMFIDSADGNKFKWFNGSSWQEAATSSSGAFSSVTSISNSAGNILLAPAVGTGTVSVTGGTASSSSTTGALVVAGGAGISGDVNAGGTFASATGVTLTNAATNGIRLYNTADQTTNFEVFKTNWNSNSLEMGVYAGGSANFSRNMSLGLASWSGGPTSLTSGINFHPYTANDFVFNFFGSTTGVANSTLVSVGQSTTLTGTTSVQNLLRISPVIQQSSSAGYNAILINPTETSVGSGEKALIRGQTDGIDRFVFNNSGGAYFAGSVGIGTTAPSTTLHIKQASTSSGLRIEESGSSSSSEIYQDVSSNLIFNRGNANIILRSGSGGEFGVKTDNVRRFTVDANGNVGIGTTTPGRLLHVLGPIRMVASTSPSAAVAGDMFIDSADGNKFKWFNGSTWQEAATSSGGAFSSVTSISNSAGNILLAPAAGTGTVSVTGGTASSSSTTGTLVVTGGAGISGDVYSGGSINAATSMVSPQVYGSAASAGDLRLDGTSHATPGNIYLATAGGRVAIGTSSATSPFTVSFAATNGTTNPYMFFNNSLTTTSDGDHSARNLYNRLSVKVGATKIESGGFTANEMRVLRNTSGTGDSGSLTGQMIGNSVFYGHDDSDVAATPSTNQAMGLKISPYYKTGTLTTMYDIYLAADSTGGTATTHYGIFQANTARNYLQGNVGIGTTTPGGLLEIRSSTNGIITSSLINPNSGSSARAQFILGNDSSTGGLQLKSSSYTTDPNSLNLFSPGALIFATAGGSNERMRISASGNLGIGTTAPTTFVEIRNPSNSNYTFAAYASATNGGGGIMVDEWGQFYLPGGQTARYDSTLQYGILDGGAGPLYLTTSTANKNIALLPSSGGKVGIGTSTPGRLLTVNGAMRMIASTSPSSAVAGDMFIDSADANKLKWHDGSAWQSAGGGSIGSSLVGIGSISNSTGDIILAPVSSSGAVTINSGTASTLTSNGALIVSGGVGISGDVNAGGTVGANYFSATTNIWSPQIYGSSSASGNIRIDGTSNATKGNVYLASAGGKVGIGITSPTSSLHVATPIVPTAWNSVGVNFQQSMTSFDDGDKLTAVKIDPTFIVPGHIGVKRYSLVVTNGNVGIGTSTPSDNLHVKDVGPTLLLEGTSTTAATSLQIVTDSSGAIVRGYPSSSAATLRDSTPLADSVALTTYTGALAPSRMAIGTMSTTPLNLITDDQVRMTITGAGKVGIGTTIPTGLLHVMGGASGADVYTETNDGTTSANLYSKSDGNQIFMRAYGSTNGAVTTDSVSLADAVALWGDSTAGRMVVGTNGALPLHLATNYRLRATIDVSGNVGIGTTVPANRLHVVETSAGALTFPFLVKNSSSNVGTSVAIGLNADISGADQVKGAIAFERLGGWSTGKLHFINDGATTSSNATLANARMTIDSSGNVGIGTTAPIKKLDLRGESNIADYGSSIYVGIENAPTAEGGNNNWSSGTSKLIQTGWTGSLDFVKFYTPGSQRTAPVMTMLSDGSVGIGTTTPYAPFHIVGNTTSSNSVAAIQNLTTGTGRILNLSYDNITNPTSSNWFIRFGDAGGAIGRVQGDGAGSITYSTASDRRIKRNIVDTHYGIDDVLKIQVRDYNPLKNDKLVTGYIAQELAEIYPIAVSKGENPEDIWTVDYGRITPLIVKGVQDIARVVDVSKAPKGAPSISIDPAGNVGIGTRTPAAALDVDGHVAFSGPSVSISSCGDSASVSGNDGRGQFKLGTGGPTSCTISFANPYSSFPYCVVTPYGTDPGAIRYWVTSNTWSLTLNLSSSAAAGQMWTYHCIQ